MAGVNPEKVFAAIRGGLAGSTVMDAKVPMMMDGNFKPGFKIDLHIKDLNNALDTGHGLGTPMLLTAQVQEMLQWLHNNGDGQSDHSAILKYCGNDSFATENGTYFELDHDGWVTEVLYHLHNPRGYRAWRAYIISTQLLKDLVDECFVHDQFSWRRDVLQANKDQLRLHAYVWNGFAAQIRSFRSTMTAACSCSTPTSGQNCSAGAAHPRQRAPTRLSALYRAPRALHQLSGG